MARPRTDNLNNLLAEYGFPVSIAKERSVKLVFHNTPYFKFLDDYRQGQIKRIETYQREQGSDIFRGCQHIITFLHDGPSRAVFIGIYRIDAHRTLAKPPKEFIEFSPNQDWRPGHHWYDMTLLDNMQELSGRLVVDWGRGRTWHQWLHADRPKKIIEIPKKDMGSRTRS